MKYSRVIVVVVSMICVSLCLGYSFSDLRDSQNSATSPEKRMKAWAHHQKLKEESLEIRQQRHHLETDFRK